MRGSRRAKLLNPWYELNNEISYVISCVDCSVTRKILRFVTTGLTFILVNMSETACRIVKLQNELLLDWVRIKFTFSFLFPAFWAASFSGLKSFFLCLSKIGFFDVLANRNANIFFLNCLNRRHRVKMTIAIQAKQFSPKHSILTQDQYYKYSSYTF